jgi:uridine kinase
VKGDILVLQEWHRRAAHEIASHILDAIRCKRSRYTMTVAGESGSGKSEMGKAIADELQKHGVRSVVLGQDDYFVLPPRANDQRRREDPEWLGPHVEVRLDLMEQNLVSAVEGAQEITKPLVDYDSNTIQEETVSLDGITVLIAEGTYTSLLKHVDTRIFIARTWQDTRADRLARDRGNEVRDPFVEQVLGTEHKIIAAHKQLADFMITKDYVVVPIS